MREYIGQQLIIGLAGEELTKDEAHFIIENNIGGVIPFARNLKSVEQIHNLVNEIQKLRYKTTHKAPLFISIDMEGGRVHRQSRSEGVVGRVLRGRGIEVLGEGHVHRLAGTVRDPVLRERGDPG